MLCERAKREEREQIKTTRSFTVHSHFGLCGAMHAVSVAQQVNCEAEEALVLSTVTRLDNELRALYDKRHKAYQRQRADFHSGVDSN